MQLTKGRGGIDQSPQERRVNPHTSQSKSARIRPSRRTREPSAERRFSSQMQSGEEEENRLGGKNVENDSRFSARKGR